MKILFVCTGNTCRSPMAEAILKSAQLPNIEVRSAGVHAATGNSMSLNAMAVLDEKQLQHQHRANQFTIQSLEWADLILTMTNSHKQLIAFQYPHALEKMFTLKEYIGENHLDVQDPYGRSLDVYRQTYDELMELIVKLQKQLKLEG